MSTTFADHLPVGDHASRPAATDVPAGTLYACTDHTIVYQSDGTTWSNWHDPTGLSGSPAAGGAVLLDSVTLGSASASEDFTIATTSRDLMIRIAARSDRADPYDKLLVRFGTGGTIDTGANYDYQATDGANTDSLTGQSAMQIGRFSMPAASQTANLFGTTIIEVPGYSGAIWKPLRSWGGFYATTSRRGETTGQWKNTGAIDTVRVYFENGNMIAGTSISIYGLG